MISYTQNERKWNHKRLYPQIGHVINMSYEQQNKNETTKKVA